MEIQEIFKELVKDDFYKSKLKDVLFQKVSETIKYNYDSEISKIVSEFFKTEFSVEIIKELESQKKLLKENILASLKDSLIDISSRIVFSPNEWTFEKFVKDNINIKKEVKL